MCHVDGMNKVAKEPLPFPAPLDRLWSLIVKVIACLHIKNHTDERCKLMYSPDERMSAEYNTMAAEQTFTWAAPVLLFASRIEEKKPIYRALPQDEQAAGATKKKQALA
ncbi:predicted protein [Nematostella vectensis]|uniref:Uncharacterized protein n=1 Tax=Nematostella vectensis TaxID=45351 RepID=A7RSG1_NEMVE|nr:predicted protein [Nematostella vectensis]|eukprot:XP_001637620.1 predicted protein [Nematostella vectensis]